MRENPDTDEAVEFLRSWPTERMHLWFNKTDPVTGEEGVKKGRTYLRTEDGYARMRTDIDAAQGKSNIYFLVNDPLDDITMDVVGKASDAQMKRAIALHADIDPKGQTLEEISARLGGYVMEPSRRIFSGGGMQALWLLRDPIEVNGDPEKIELVANLNRQLANDLKGDHCVAVSWVLRLPGTVNLPNKKKRESGREPALARLVAVGAHDYPVSIFRQAEPEQRALVPTGGKLPPVNIEWDAAESFKNTFTIDALRARGVAPQALALLEHGDAENKYTGDRSNMALAIAGALFRAGLSPEESAGVLGTKSFAGNAHFNKMKSNGRKRAIQNAINKSRTQSLAEQRRKAMGAPEWRDYDSKIGIYPQPTLANAVIGIKALGVECRLDLFHNNTILLSLNGQTEELGHLVGELSDNTLRAIRSLINNKWQLDLGEKNVLDGVMEIALDHAFDPVLDYLDGLIWDRVPRLGRAAVDYFNAPDTKLNNAIIEATLIGSVRRARQPGAKFDTIAILESQEGFNKSTTIRCLYGDENYSDQTILGISDREVQEQLGGVWGHECADLSGMHKTDVERVKAFASRQVDRARPAYGRVLKKQPRRSVLWATTNDSEYLQSQSGNRRMWPLEVLRPIDLEKLARDRDQLWAEAAYRESQIRPGVNINIDEALWAAAGEAQDKRRVQDPWEDILDDIPSVITLGDPAYSDSQKRTIIHHTGAPEWKLRVSAQDLLVHILHIPAAMQNQGFTKRLSTVMKVLGWQRPPGGQRVNGESVRGYWKPDPEAPAQAALALGPEPEETRHAA